MAIITTSSQEEQPQAQQPQPQPELQQPQPTVQSSEATASFKEKIAVPYAFYALRIAQAIVAVVILGLTGDLLSQNGGGSFAAESLSIFAAVATIIAEIYYVIAETVASEVYNYVAILSLDSLLAIFWLSAMSDSASLRSQLNELDDFLNYLDLPTFQSYLNILTADTVMEALEFVLFVAAVIVFGIAVHQHQTAGNAAVTYSTPAMVEAGNQQHQPAAQPYAEPAPEYNAVSSGAQTFENKA